MAGKAKEKQSKYRRELWVEGTYILKDGLINGYPYWLKTDGRYGISFEKDGSKWFVGPKSHLGKNAGFLKGPDGKDSYPNDVKQGWLYPDNGWHDTGLDDVIFKAI